MFSVLLQPVKQNTRLKTNIDTMLFLILLMTNPFPFILKLSFNLVIKRNNKNDKKQPPIMNYIIFSIKKCEYNVKMLIIINQSFLSFF